MLKELLHIKKVTIFVITLVPTLTKLHISQSCRETTWLYMCVYIYILYVYIHTHIAIYTVLPRLSDPLGTKAFSDNQKVWIIKQIYMKYVDKNMLFCIHQHSPS